MMTWYEIWQKKGSNQNSSKKELVDLIALDGFDTGHGSMDEQKWNMMINLIKQKIYFKNDDNIVEIGCGAGAFLFPFYEENKYKIIGIDYSVGLLDIAKKIMPKANFVCAQANKLPLERESCNITLCNSVFHYFSDLDYAKQTLLEILRVLKKGGECLILDINDLSKKDYAEKKRRDELGNEEYEKRYKDLSQIYYDKSWFENFAIENNLEFEIFDQDIPGYVNAQWRFNFYFKKL
ncbi:MAG: hypothetical protein A2493_01860 [Candidatus Magasanikbacteria bacterium RIFOXYC12_FULL_33_11]|uniref:Methyltransferase type 11 domain-containing protein n=1 Tax=Candidatus Magasanikbacteria bacterium RIFOXYC12_FULL_33_11 TaxID=1798701 RepID=A0A1F6NM59_9BACT|nr:MAG: hypothetical protein A2493_01860 [Candidatus Magasanikbacteria bacterium RIFOXYC12_FULL_33_11]